MAIDLKGTQTYPEPYRFTADVTTTEIILPPAARKISFYSPTKKLYISKNATDGGTLPTHYWEIPADRGYEMQLGSGMQNPGSLFVSVSTGSGEVFILLEEEA